MDLEPRQFWADAATRNCVWLFQTKQKGVKGDMFFEYWHTEKVFLIQKEAKKYGEARPYAWGKFKEGWRIYGVPCDGIMVELLGRHNKEFENKVEHISHPKVSIKRLK